MIFEIDRIYGYNEAFYFAQRLVQSGIEAFSASKNYRNNYNNRDCNGFMTVLNEFNLNLRRLIDYIFFDLYSQGYPSIGSSF